MRNIIGILILALVSTVALALPAPKDIEAAVQAGNLAQAETMLHEVIQARPGSARAHYELGQVLARAGKYDAARRELLEAERIDPSLKFATDPLHFRNLVNRLSTAAAARPADAGRAPAAVPAQPAAAAFPLGYLLVGGGLIVVIGLLIARAMAARAPVPAAGPNGGGGFGNGAGYAPGGVPANSGGGIGGAVLGGVAGLAAGYGLAKMLEGRDSGGGGASLNDGGHIPIDPPSADFGAFDAGSGSDWDDSAPSGDDNW